MRWNFHPSLKDLINIFKVKFTNLTTLFFYPGRILPNTSYVNPININDLNDNNRYVIVRRSEKSVEETFNEYNILREDIILDKRIPGLSMNLLGGFFKIKHIKFNQTGFGSKNWDSKTNIRLGSLTSCISQLDTFCPIYFFIRDFQNVQFPYNRPNDNNARKFLAALGQTNPTGENLNLTAKTEILHKPTNLNYWHVEFTIREINQEGASIVANASSTWKQNLIQSIYHLISMKAMHECVDIPSIGNKFFKKIAS